MNIINTVRSEVTTQGEILENRKRRNQIIEIDTLNTTVEAGQDTIAVAGSGTATYTTTSTYVAPSSY